MAVDLADYADALKREVTPPGSGLYSTVNEDVWTQYLTDAFWEAKLDGFFPGYEASPEGLVDPDLPREWVALVILYAGVKVLRNNILNTQTSFRATAGPVEYEVQNSATVLAEMLKQLKTVKDRYLEIVENIATPVALTDAYTVRQLQSTIGGLPYGGYWMDLWTAPLEAAT